MIPRSSERNCDALFVLLEIITANSRMWLVVGRGDAPLPRNLSDSCTPERQMYFSTQSRDALNDTTPSCSADNRARS
eukprot:IDg14274t1